MGWPPEQVLNVSIACWCYVPSKPTAWLSTKAYYQQKLDVSPLLYWLLWERSWVQSRRSVSCRAVDWVGIPSSLEQLICSNLLTTTWKVAIRGPREICMVKGHTRTERGKRVAWWSSFPLQGVHRFESPWLLVWVWHRDRTHLVSLAC
jgi:hypothetical protein